MKVIVTKESIENKIYLISGHRVILDRDLARLYGVTTFNLNKAIKRNIERFPKDFMFQLTQKELKFLIFQIGISKEGRGGSRYMPYAFTQEGIAMLSSVLRSKRAIQVNIVIMRTFVRLKQMISLNRELLLKLELLEKKIEKHDEEIQTIFQAIKQLMSPPEKPRRKIGFY